MILDMHKEIQLYLLLMAAVLPQFILGQNYLGMGGHVAPPITISNCCNSYVDVKPILAPAYSLSYKKIWGRKKGDKWYLEAGGYKMGLGFNFKRYSNDTLNVWTESNIRHVGFPSIFIGAGKYFYLNKKRSRAFSAGLDGAFRIVHDYGGFFNSRFGLTESLDDHTFPFSLRLNAGYNIHCKVFRQVPIHVQFYTKLSFQAIARSPQYIVDPITGERNEDGKYSLNNSELGVKLYADLGKEYYKIDWEKERKKTKVKRTGRANIRWSVEGQLYAPDRTEYYIPQVPDSFSLKGVKISLANQINVKSEVVHFKNQDWATVFAIGLGQTSSTTHFIAQPAFTRDSQLIDNPTGGPIGWHLIPSLGLAHKHAFGKKQLQHSLSVTLVIPITKEDDLIIMDERPFRLLPDHSPHLLDGDISHRYGRNDVLFGLEYQPEILFRMDNRVFMGLGLVFNYSWGVIAHGRVTVDNEQTQYYGGITQGFSKIGITARVGWNSQKQI